MGRFKLGAAFATVIALACATQGLAAPAGALKPVNGVQSAALQNATGVAIAPNGKHAYGLGYASDSIGVFSRNANSGAVAFVEQESGNGLASPMSVVVSPDNKNVYVAGDISDSVHSYSRAANGELSFIDADFDGMDGAEGLDGAHDVVISPDGKHVYAVGREDDAIALLERLPDGELQWADAFIDGLGGVDDLVDPRGVTISPDGKHVYAVTAGSGSLVTFKRSKATGQLDFVESDSIPSAGNDVAVSPDGKRVYTAENAGVRSFKRNAKTGALTNPKFTDTPVTSGIAPAPAHDAVYATYGNGVATLAVRKGGKLAEIDFDGDAALGQSEGVDVSDDGRHVIIAGAPGITNGTLAAYSRQPTVELKGKKKQAAKRLTVRAECTAACRVTVTGKGLKKVSRKLRAGKARKLRLRFKGTPAGGKLVIKAKAKAGNRKAADKLAVRLK